MKKMKLADYPVRMAITMREYVVPLDISMKEIRESLEGSLTMSGAERITVGRVRKGGKYTEVVRVTETYGEK
jgi:hypothetical protein